MEKTNIKHDPYFVNKELKKVMGWMNSGNELNASIIFLNVTMNQYSNLNTEEKKQITVDVNALEKKAVETYVDNGDADNLSHDLLKKYGII